jgi:predicted DNA-binding transcriptional regulator AlpA
MDTPRPKSVKQLCDYYGISKPHYYALKAKGLAPAELKLGNRTIITPEAERAWVEANTVRAAANANATA